MKKLILIAGTIVILTFNFSYCRAQKLSDPTDKQVKFFFPGAKLPGNYIYNFPVQFQEVNIKAKDSTVLSGLLFKSGSSKGVILYLHGNTDALDKWGNISKTYTGLHYDLFMLDYRGYGKSGGAIKNEEQLYTDVQAAYNYLN